MLIGPINEVHLFLGVVSVSRKLLYTDISSDDGRKVLFDFTTNNAI